MAISVCAKASLENPLNKRNMNKLFLFLTLFLISSHILAAADAPVKKIRPALKMLLRQGPH